MSVYRQRKRHSNIAPTQEKRERRVNPWLSLAQGIVLQAIFDWRVLEAGGSIKDRSVTFEALRIFFRSPWCDTLLMFTGADPDYIRNLLERELAEVGSGAREPVRSCNQRPKVQLTKRRQDDLKQLKNYSRRQ